MVEKATIESENGTTIMFHFNPDQLVISKANTWFAGPRTGRTAPALHFAGGKAGSIRMQLIIDSTASGTPVTRDAALIEDMMTVDTNLPSFDQATNSGRPPWVRLHWGDFHSYKAIIEDLTVTYTYFSADGIALRAKADLVLRQYEEADTYGAQNPSSGTPEPNRVHQVQPGETLDRIAAHYFDDSTRWRSIAEANQIVDPLDIEPGSQLVIPKLER